VTAVHTRSSTEAAQKAAAGGCAFDFRFDSAFIGLKAVNFGA
jgi:hypothetical protein